METAPSAVYQSEREPHEQGQRVQVVRQVITETVNTRHGPNALENPCQDPERAGDD